MSKSALKTHFIFAIITFVFAIFCFPNVASAGGNFTVYVGYTGGPYYLKTTLSESEMKQLSADRVYEYSTIDSGHFLIKGAGRGVEVTSIFSKAGIDTSNMKRFYFATADGYVSDDGGEGNTAWYYSTLTQKRYYYPRLAEFWDFQNKKLTEPEGVSVSDVMRKSAVETKTILAYESSFRRVETVDAFTATPTLQTHDGYRLMLGQTEEFNRGNAFNFAQSVKSMTCIFGGAPKIDVQVEGANEDGSFTADVGQTIKIKANIEADDPLVSQYGIKDIRWSVSDASVADFVRDANGDVVLNDDGTVSLVVYGKGSVSVGAEYGDSPYEEYVSHGSVSGTGTGNGSGSGEGESSSGGSANGAKGTGGEGNLANLDGEMGTPVTFDSSAQTAESQALAGQEAEEEVSDIEEGASSEGGGEVVSTAFKLNVQNTQQDDLLQNEAVTQALMLDFNTYAPPLAFLLFACITFGVVWRVKKTQRDKDPFMNL